MKTRFFATFVLALALLSLNACRTLNLQEKSLVKRVAGGELNLTQEAIDHPQLRFESERVQFGSEQIYVMIASRADAKATVLYFGGNNSTVEKHHSRLIEQYQALPVNLIMADHLGYGASTGTASFDGMQAAAVAVYDAAIGWGKNRASVQGKPIIVHGLSIGSFSAGAVADRRTLAGLILEGSATTAKEWAEHLRTASILRRMMVTKVTMAASMQQRGNLAVAQRLNEPTLFFVGAKDTQTPPALSQKLFDAAPAALTKKLTISRNGTHGNAGFKPEFARDFRAMFLE